MVDFNPRSHEGSDSEDRINIYQVNISIHAPTRGATPVSTPIPGIHCIFQSTLPRGERLEEKILSEELQKFQSTLPRGERPNCFDHCQGEMDISIHAPTRGATFKDCYRLLCWIFQSTLPRGERQYFHFCSKMLKKISIHAPTRGATTFPGTFRSTYNYFNPRSHEGSDRK